MVSKTQWTLITGGAKRLGAEICKTLAAKGYPVLIHYNTSSKEAEALVLECKSLGTESALIQGDFSSVKKVDEFLNRQSQQFPNIKNLVNNVGNYVVAPALETSSQQWHDLFQTNLHAPIEIIRALMPNIKKQQGSIINIGVTGLDHVPANLYSTAYLATKLSLWMATRSLAKEFAPFHVRVNMVSPGILDNAVDLPSDTKSLPMGRPGSPKEVARVVEFLLDKNNQYITGQNIEVAGGLRLT